MFKPINKKLSDKNKELVKLNDIKKAFFSGILINNWLVYKKS